MARAAGAERSLSRRVFDPLPPRHADPARTATALVWSTTVLSLRSALVVLIGTGAFHDMTTGKITLSVVVTLLTAPAGSSAPCAARPPTSGTWSGPPSRRSSRDHSTRSEATSADSSTRRPGAERAAPASNIVDSWSSSTTLSDASPNGRSRCARRSTRLLVARRCRRRADRRHADPRNRRRVEVQGPRTALPHRHAGRGQPATRRRSFGELYLEKIVQFRFDLPTHDLTSLTSGDPVAQDAEARVDDDTRPPASGPAPHSRRPWATRPVGAGNGASGASFGTARRPRSGVARCDQREWARGRQVHALSRTS